MNLQKNTSHVFSNKGITHFKDRLQQAMGTKSNLSVGNSSGLSDKTIKDYLTGKTTPTLERLEKLAEALNCSVEWLGFGVCNEEQSISEVKEEKTEYNNIDEMVFLLKKLSKEDQERIMQQIVNNGVKSLIVDEQSQHAKAIADLILTLNTEEQREILSYIQAKKLGAIIERTDNRKAG